MQDQESKVIQMVLTSCERSLSKKQLEDSMKTLSHSEERVESFKECLLEQASDWTIQKQLNVVFILNILFSDPRSCAYESWNEPVQRLITGAIKNISSSKAHQLCNVLKRWATAKYFSESYTFEWLTSLESKFPEQPRQPPEETESVAIIPSSSSNLNKRNKSSESNSSMMNTVILAMRKMLYGIFQAFEMSTTSITEKVNYRVMIMTAFLLLRNLENDIEASDNHPALVMACFYLSGKAEAYFVKTERIRQTSKDSLRMNFGNHPLPTDHEIFPYEKELLDRIAFNTSPQILRNGVRIIRNWYLFNAFPINTLNPTIVDNITRTLTREELLSDEYLYKDNRYHHNSNIHPEHLAIFFLMLELTSPFLSTPHTTEEIQAKIHNTIKLILDFKVISDSIMSNTQGFRELVKYGMKTGVSFVNIPECEMICRDICGTIEKRYGHPKGRVRGMSTATAATSATVTASCEAAESDNNNGDSGVTSRAAVTPKTPYYTNTEEAQSDSNQQELQQAAVVFSPVITTASVQATTPQKQAAVSEQAAVQQASPALVITPNRVIPPPPIDRPPEPYKPPPPPAAFTAIPAPSKTQTKPPTVAVAKNDQGLFSIPLPSSSVLGKHSRSSSVGQAVKQENLIEQLTQQPKQSQPTAGAAVNRNNNDVDNHYNRYDHSNSKRMKTNENHVSSSSTSSQQQHHHHHHHHRRRQPEDHHYYSSSDRVIEQQQWRTGAVSSNPNVPIQPVNNSRHYRDHNLSQESSYMSQSEHYHNTYDRRNNDCYDDRSYYQQQSSRRSHDQDHQAQSNYHQQDQQHEQRNHRVDDPMNVPVSSSLASRLGEAANQPPSKSRHQGGGEGESSHVSKSSRSQPAQQRQQPDTQTERQKQELPSTSLGKRKADKTIDEVHVPPSVLQPDPTMRIAPTDNNTTSRPNTSSNIFDRLSPRPNAAVSAATAATATSSQPVIARSNSQESAVSREPKKSAAVPATNENRFIQRSLFGHLSSGPAKRKSLGGKPAEEAASLAPVATVDVSLPVEVMQMDAEEPSAVNGRVAQAKGGKSKKTDNRNFSRHKRG